ncbi:hypothetical protein SAMN03080617_01290 [Algoriphagus alkaliphilus]|uniref:Uncharacterized protein n=1 Tax=Algoriphagus alkaliphilus TaxID=279824 RepID=A0A1G5WRY7_9BACT|nr:hypothetical protein [Algoriphagus alkaliphilus]SDA60873.1 hypothetical protein SAMN03080617_01290 [Algoriphagus alkaliphilus]
MKILLNSRSLIFKAVLLVFFFSCSSEKQDPASFLLKNYNLDIVKNKENSVYLFIDLNSCGTCLNHIITQLKREQIFSKLNLVFIENQSGRKLVENELNLKSNNVFFIKEEDFVDLNNGYGFFLYLYSGENLLKRLDLNTINVEESFNIAISFFKNEL